LILFPGRFQIFHHFPAFSIISLQISSAFRPFFQVMNFSNVRLLRNVKRDTLRLVRSFLDAADAAAPEIAQRFVPPLLEMGDGTG